jgi:hypothetical protein
MAFVQGPVRAELVNLPINLVLGRAAAHGARVGAVGRVRGRGGEAGGGRGGGAARHQGLPGRRVGRVEGLLAGVQELGVAVLGLHPGQVAVAGGLVRVQARRQRGRGNAAQAQHRQVVFGGGLGPRQAQA